MARDIYLDHCAGTCVDPEVKKEMDKYHSKDFGNPNSFHSFGLKARNAVEKARGKISEIINCKADEIYFTGCGTESCNLAIKGVAFAKKKGHVITSAIEHHAVLDTCKWLKTQGFDLTVVKVDKYGLVDPRDVEKAIRKDTILITIMYANNEIGTVQPISAIGKIAKKHNVLFHTDACQAGMLELDVGKLNVDMMTLNGSKIYGPKGIGMLYVRRGVKLVPLLHGGGQEHGLRSGTLNVPGIIGFAKALELIQKNRKKEVKHLIKLRDKLIKGALKIPKSFLNGHPTKRLPKSASFTFLDVEGESMVLKLDEKKIYASTGSACTSSNLEPSHVILAIGISKNAAHGSLRFTLGKETTEKDIDSVLKVLPGIVAELRKISPVRMRGRR